MPIPNAVAAAAAPDKAAASEKAAAPAPAHGWVVRTAAAAAEDLAQLFSGLPFGVSRAAPPAAPTASDLRGQQQ